MGGNAKWRSRVVWTKDANGKKVPLRDADGKIVKVGVRQYSKKEKATLKKAQESARERGFQGMADRKNNGEQTQATPKTFRDKVNEAKSKEELSTAMREKYQEGFNERFVNANNLNNVKRAMNTIAELEERFPFMKGFVKEFDIRSDAVAAMSQSGKLTINPRYWNIEDNPSFKDDGNGWSPKNSSLESDIAHEFGHAIHNWWWEQVKASNPPKSISQMIQQIESRRSGKFMGDIWKRAKQIAKAKSKDALFSQISGYAKTSPMEAFAEAFADIYSNGDNASTASKAMYQAMSEALQQYGASL